MENKKELSKGNLLFNAILFAFSIIIITIIITTPVGILSLIFEFEVKSWIELLLGAFSTILAALYVIKIIKKEHIISLKERLDLKKINFMYLIGSVFVSLSVSAVLDYLLVQVLKYEPAPMRFDITLSISGIIALIAIIIIAPIFEECIYRFGIMEKLGSKFGKIPTILVSAVLFALPHFYGVGGSLSVMILAIVMGLIYYNTRNLAYVIIIHFFNNVLATIQHIYSKQNPNAFIVNFPTNLIHVAILLIVLAIGIVLINSQKNKVKYIQQ